MIDFELGDLRDAEANFWTQAEAVELCKRIEAVCPAFGCHVALTGGVLYKEGKRKDLDLLFYRIRQTDQIDVPGLLAALERKCGVTRQRGWGWVHKAATDFGKSLDLFFPEAPKPDPFRPEGFDADSKYPHRR